MSETTNPAKPGTVGRRSKAAGSTVAMTELERLVHASEQLVSMCENFAGELHRDHPDVQELGEAASALKNKIYRMMLADSVQNGIGNNIGKSEAGQVVQITPGNALSPKETSAKPNARPQELERIPLFRLCHLLLRSPEFPSSGMGLFEVMGYENLNTENEAYLLRRVNSDPVRDGDKAHCKISRVYQTKGWLRAYTELSPDPVLNATAASKH